MRIAIDLHYCQQANTALARDSLAMVRCLASNRGKHTLLIAFNSHFPQRIDSLRVAFNGLLPAECMLVYELPTPDGTARVQRMIELIRENFFASRGIDLVFTPGVPADAGNATAGHAVSTHFLNAIGVAAPSESAAMQADGKLVVEIGAHPERAAARAWRRFEETLSGQSQAPRRAARPAVPPLLAWVAAQPPGDIDAQGMAELARWYELVLVLPDPVPPESALRDMVRGVDWFEEHASRCERIVYAIGNSPRHRFMLALLAKHPGIVLLQDFFLGALIDAAGETQAWRKTLFASHGFTGLADELVIGRPSAAEKYPLNKTVFDLAAGVIVESEDLIGQAQAWYGRDAARNWHCAPSLAALAAGRQDAGGAAWADAIEAITGRSQAAHYRALLQALWSNGCPSDIRHPELLAAARAIAANQPAAAPRQLLVDVSAMVQLDAKTGISRVVRSILLALIGAPPQGYRIEAVYGDGGNRCYRYARKFTLALIGADDIELEDAPIEQRPGDIFVGVDVAASITTQNAARMADMRNHGMQVFFVVHDILPVLLPNMFAYGTDTYFRKYLDTITRHADGLLCTTRAGADTLSDWIAAHPAPRAEPLHIGYFHLGADLAASAPSSGLPPSASRLFAAAAQRPTLLMVGTLEPRKAHAQALAAMELLWSEQIEVNLIIVGKPGWMVERLIKKIKTHPRLETRLFWLTEASDEMLAKLYRSCSALLAPSLGEGFGLPLIEAAQHELPIVARMLPVFQEICGDHAFYFEGEEPRALADALRAWLDLFAAGQAPSSAGLPWISWAESTRRLLDCAVHQQWYRSLPGTSVGL